MRRLSIVKERLISTFQSNDAILAIISNSLLLAIPLMPNFNLPPSLRICFIFSILSLTFKFKVSFSELLVGTSWLLFPLMSSIKPKKWLFLVTKLKLLSFSMWLIFLKMHLEMTISSICLSLVVLWPHQLTYCVLSLSYIHLIFFSILQQNFPPVGLVFSFICFSHSLLVVFNHTVFSSRKMLI